MDDDLHKVFLGDDVFAIDDLLEDVGQDDALVHVEIDAVELAEADEVSADEDAELFALHLAPLAVLGEALVLQSDPELVHLDEVGEDEAEAVLQVASGSTRC